MYQVNRILLRASLLLILLAVGTLAILWHQPANTIQPASASAATPTSTPMPVQSHDPALRNPMFLAIANEHGSDWEARLHPMLKLWVGWQRTIGTHAIITGIGGLNGDLSTHPAASDIMIAVTEWDGTDLFSLGLPVEYEGKPVKIVKMGFAHSLSYTPLSAGQEPR